MEEQTWAAFSERMAYEGELHIAVEPLDMRSPALAGYNDRNLYVLRALASLDERRPENGGEEDSPLMQELLRMDSKINVLMEVVNRLLIPPGQLPAREEIRFNALGVVLPQALLPASERLLVRLHFEACRVLPLELPGRVERQLDDQKVFVAFTDCSEMVAEGLERVVFRHHRRKVAESRITAM